MTGPAVASSGAIVPPLRPGPVDPPRTADRIVAAALAAFAQRGVEATSLDALAADLGIRKQTILYWFPSKEALLLAVIDHTVGELETRLTAAVLGAPDDLAGRIAAAVDATFRMGTTDPALIAVVREVTRLGPPASTHLAAALDPLLGRAAVALAGVGIDADRARWVLVDAGARVIGMATEAEVRSDLGRPADRAWLRQRRRALQTSVYAALAPGGSAPGRRVEPPVPQSASGR